MTTNVPSGMNERGERGVALVAVLLLLMIVSALCTTMAISGNTDTMIARNHQVGTEAKAAAEAGLIHGTQLVVANLQVLQPAAVPAALNGLLNGPDNDPAAIADNGSLEALAPCPGPACIPRAPARVALNGSARIAYEVRLFDEDDPDRDRGVTLTPGPGGDVGRIGENDQPYVDVNQRLVLRAIGYSWNDAQATIEATLAPVPFPAILTNGNLLVTGNATINGQGGGVHTNSNLTVSGSANIAGEANAAGTATQVGGGSNVGNSDGDPDSGQATIAVPTVNAAAWIGNANFLLNNNGTRTTVATGVVDACPCNNWTFAAGTWVYNSNAAPPPGMYYVDGAVVISGGPGTPMAPAQLGLIATGSITISGNPDLQPPLVAGVPVTPWIVTNGDLNISGNLTAGVAGTPGPPPTPPIEGQIWVREQMDISGNLTLFGQVIVADAANASPLVTTNRMTGSSSITNAGTSASSTYAISAWRWGS